jgi:NTP pyrophosphatase (non-canonical NTP hydrolase)
MSQDRYPSITQRAYDASRYDTVLREGRQTVPEIVEAAHANSMAKGFWDDQKRAVNSTRLDQGLVQRTIPEKLALIHSEVSEALEDYRDGAMVTTVDEKGKPVGFPSELADIVIRVCDLAGALEIDLDAEIARKMRHNAGRPRKHGKVC